MKGKHRIASLLLVLCMVCAMAVPQTAVNVEAATAASVTGNSNEHKIYSFLTEKMGLNSAAASGILANVYRECRFNEKAANAQNTSYGICQWYSANYTRLVTYCAQNGMDYHTLTAQLYFLQNDLENNAWFRKNVLNQLKAVPDTAEGACQAGYIFCYNYERPKNYNTTASDSRGLLAQTTFWPVYGGRRIIVELEAATHTHSYMTAITPSTLSAAGSIVSRCECGVVQSSTPIAQIASVSLTKTSFVYNGKNNRPTVTVKDSNGKNIDASNYAVTYSGNGKSVGVYTATVTFSGNYDGRAELTYQVVPKATAITKVYKRSRAIQLKWKKVTKQTSGYELQYAMSWKFDEANTKTLQLKSKTTSVKILNLKGKQKYYVRMRTFKTVKVNGEETKVYSSWCKAVKVTTKK